MAKRSIANLALTITAPQKRFQRDMTKAGKTVNRFGRTAKTASKSTRAFTKSVLASTTAILGFGSATVLLGLAFRKAIRLAADFDRKMAEVSTIADQTSAGMGQLTDNVLALSTTLGRAPVEVAAGLYQTLSSGITETAEATEFLAVAMRAAIGGVAETSQAVDLLTNVINAYGLEASDATRISDVAFKTVQLGKVTLSTLADSMGKVLSVGAQLDVPFEELFAATATLTKGGLAAEVAVNALRTTLITVLKPTDAQRAKARDLGIVFSAAAVKAMGFRNWLRLVEQQTRGNTEALAKLFPETRGLIGVLALAGEQSQEFTDILAQTTEATGAAAEAFRKMAESDSFKLDVAVNKLNVSLTKLGIEVLPGVAEGLTAVADAFAGATEVGVFSALAGGAGVKKSEADLRKAERRADVHRRLNLPDAPAVAGRQQKRKDVGNVLGETLRRDLLAGFLGEAGVAKLLPDLGKLTEKVGARKAQGKFVSVEDRVALFGEAPAELREPAKAKKQKDIFVLPFDPGAILAGAVKNAVGAVLGKAGEAGNIIRRAGGIGGDILRNARQALDAPDRRRDVGRMGGETRLSRMAITGIAAARPTEEKKQTDLLEGMRGELAIIAREVRLLAMAGHN